MEEDCIVNQGPQQAVELEKEKKKDMNKIKKAGNRRSEVQRLAL
jgi:hypothetical protein